MNKTCTFFFPFGLALAAVLLSSPAQSASFDCAKARSFAEKGICATPSLSAADERLAKVYHKAKTATGNGPEFRARVKALWLQREMCRTLDCVSAWYTDATAFYEALLNNPAANPGGFVAGLDQLRVLRLGDDHENRGLTLAASGLRFSLFFDQVDMGARLDDGKKPGERTNLGFIFDDKLASLDGEKGEGPAASNLYALGLRDVDGDGAVEAIFVGCTDREDDMNAVAVYIYRVRDGRHWLFSADDILGQPQVRITDGTIRIDRHVHGFYHEWTWKNDSRDFADTSNL